MKPLFKLPIQPNSNSQSIMKDVIPSTKAENQGENSDLQKDLTAGGQKNLWTGTKSSLTYTKRANHHYVPKFHKPFNDQQNQQIRNVFESLIIIEETEGNVVYRRNRLTTSGTNSSAVPHGLMQQRVKENKPYKPSDGKVETWLDRMPQRKLNQGLTYLQKKNTQERQMEMTAQQAQ